MCIDDSVPYPEWGGEIGADEEAEIGYVDASDPYLVCIDDSVPYLEWGGEIGADKEGEIMCIDTDDPCLVWNDKKIPLHENWKHDVKLGEEVKFCKSRWMKVAEPPAWRPGARIKIGKVVTGKEADLMCSEHEGLFVEWKGKKFPLHKNWNPDIEPGERLEFCKRGGMRVVEPPERRPGFKIKVGIFRRTTT